MCAEAAVQVVVLAMNVGGYSTAECDMAGARNYRQEPSTWYTDGQHIGYRHPCRAAQYSCLIIKLEEGIQVAAFEQEVCQCAVTIAASGTPGYHRITGQCFIP